MASDQERIYGGLGTMYQRCGGVFGVSAFCDRCMDMWMADLTLNENLAVATWHNRAQRCGFKFLVTQIVCQLTGGPQQYTGRDMALAHKHLNISQAEWDKFMALFNTVCAEFGLGAEDVEMLNVLVISMEYDCVVQPGERVPPNPGPARHTGTSLYARCGGVYPIALFSDRLVDTLLADDRLKIPADGQTRNEASLKYLFTELVCNAAGGPEVVTAKQAKECKLLVPYAGWEVLMAVAAVAADHLPQAVQAQVVHLMMLIRNSVVDPDSPKDAPPISAARSTLQVKDLRSAAAGTMLPKAVIEARHADPGSFIAARHRVLGDRRTLYGRGGGVFGLAQMADQLMDAWMRSPGLNANPYVTRWHKSHQCSGFKFLVTQIMGYLTGGPQRYTGRSMQLAHKHLQITSAQWDVFMNVAKRVFVDLTVPEATVVELLQLLGSFKHQCTLGQGEAPPKDPQLATTPFSGSEGTLYCSLGGVYPIAQFVDSLLQAVLKGDRVKGVNVDPPRNVAGLRYLVTEVLCSATGGPERVTCRGFNDAKLGVPIEEWPQFLSLAAEAAAMWPTPQHRTAVLTALSQAQADLCEGEGGIGEASTLTQLTAGWQPNAPPPGAGGGCPFGFRSSSTAAANPPSKAGGGCPFGFRSSSTAAATPPSKAGGEHISEQQLEAALTLRQAGMDGKTICSALHLDHTSLQAALDGHSGGGGGGEGGSGSGGIRQLENATQDKLDELLEEAVDLCCPITLMLFEQPVTASDGFVYEKQAIETLISGGGSSPMTREKLKRKRTVTPAHKMLQKANNFRKQRTQQLIQFGNEVAASEPAMAMAAVERAREYGDMLGQEGAALAQQAIALGARLN